MTKLHELVRISDAQETLSAFTLYKATGATRFSVAAPNYVSGYGQFWANPTDRCADSPQKVHPKFVVALLASEAGARKNSGIENIQNWHIPQITFETDEATRRSMTLNGMRMSTEYFHSNSPRVFQLIEQRLQQNQTDVVHDVLVYLMSQVLEAQANARESRLLQAESIAAYLGLGLAPTQKLLLEPHLSPTELTQRIESGTAGEVRRSIDVSALIENQLSRLLPELEKARAREDNVISVIDPIAEQLYNYSRAG